MSFRVGVKTDPVEYRYSYEWLFGILESLGLKYAQLGSSLEMFTLPDRYFLNLRRQAEAHGVIIHSCFTAHRELGGLLSEDDDLRRVARENYRRWIEIGSLVGATSVGSNPGAIYRDQMSTKKACIERYLDEMAGLAEYAAVVGLEALTLETMSAMAEPPTTGEEIVHFMERLNPRLPSEEPASPAPVYLCGDTAHGYADELGTVIESNLEIFELSIPWMWEFHIKNTDRIFNSTFGFSPEEQERGIVDLAHVGSIAGRNAEAFPRTDIVAYLELPGPKLGRDYSDNLLEQQLSKSVSAILSQFVPATEAAIAS